MKSFSAWKPQSADVVLEGSRVRLRPAIEEDWAAWVAVREANRAHLKALEPRWPEDALTESFFRRRLGALRRDWREGLTCAFLIRHKEQGRLIGGFNLNHICRGAAQQATLGYWLDRAWEGQGLMTEAATLAADFAFGPLMLHRLHAATLPHNERSRNLLKRLGFAEEGFAQKYVQIDGVWADHVLFGLTAEDWQGRK
ncbi:MAG: GNAT family N-acetyltransferase [Terriglobia bacterium]